MPKKHYLLVVLLMPVLLWGQKSAVTVTKKSESVHSPACAYPLQDPLLEKLLGP